MSKVGLTKFQLEVEVQLFVSYSLLLVYNFLVFFAHLRAMRDNCTLLSYKYSILFVGFLWSVKILCEHNLYVPQFSRSQPLMFIDFQGLSLPGREHFTMNCTRSKCLEVLHYLWLKFFLFFDLFEMYI